jgi:hypothetical protein
MSLFPVLPFLVTTNFRRDRDGLVYVRSMFVAYASLIVAILAIALFIAPSQTGDRMNESLAFALTVASGLAATGFTLGLARRFRPNPGRELREAPDSMVAAVYRTHFFLRIAVAAVPALVGARLAFSSGSVTPVLAGVAFTTLGLSFASPSRGRLRKTEAQFRTLGWTGDLIQALRLPLGPRHKQRPKRSLE